MMEQYSLYIILGLAFELLVCHYQFSGSTIVSGNGMI